MSKLLDTLKKTRTLIRKGWTQGVYVSYGADNACYCLAGALRFSGSDPYREFGRLERLVRGSMKALGFRNEVDMVLWNDAAERRKSHVVQRLSDAIKKLEAAT
jgi:hypothetical protein